MLKTEVIDHGVPPAKSGEKRVQNVGGLVHITDYFTIGERCQPSNGIHAWENAAGRELVYPEYMQGNREGQAGKRSPQIKEQLCDRLMLVCEASLLPKGQFAKRVGLTPQQLTNISNYRNAPSHETIARVCREFGLTPNWFYDGDMVGLKDPELAARLRPARDTLSRAN